MSKMVNENTMFNIMNRIHAVLESYRIMRELTPDEEISLKRALDVAADRWFEEAS